MDRLTAKHIIVPCLVVAHHWAIALAFHQPLHCPLEQQCLGYSQTNTAFFRTPRGASRTSSMIPLSIDALSVHAQNRLPISLQLAVSDSEEGPSKKKKKKAKEKAKTKTKAKRKVKSVSKKSKVSAEIAEEASIEASSSKTKKKAKRKAKSSSKKKAKAKTPVAVDGEASPKMKRKMKVKTKKSKVASPVNKEETLVPVSASSTSDPDSTDTNTIKRSSSNVGSDGIYYGPNPDTPDILDFDLTGGRPGPVVESFEDLDKKQKIFDEIESGERTYPEWINEYGIPDDELYAKYDTDDPDAIDVETLGKYDITDLASKFDWEWDPEKDPDPNEVLEGVELLPTGDLGSGRYLKETPKDEDGIEIGFTSFYGTANPIDLRTEVGLRESYMVDPRTKNDDLLAPQFPEGDVEIGYNEDIAKLRRSLDVIETYVDEFLGEDLPVPRHKAKWYGLPDVTKYPKQNYTNNRFTKVEDLTNFDELTPFRARQRAVELARARNAEWLPDGVSQAWHIEQRRPYEEKGTLVGSLRKGDCDPEIVEAIQPALKILGSCVDLLSIELGTVFRFHYHGLMKNRHGMESWTKTLIRDCGVEVTGVVFETGFRKRDPSYDSGDPYHGFIS